MLNIIIQAGFGNQLFQYAMGYTLAKRLNQPLQLDVSFFEYAKDNNFNNLRINNLDKLSLINPNFYNQPRKYYKYRYGAKIKNRIFRKLLNFKYPVLWEDVKNCREYQKDVIERASIMPNVSLYGFWQHPKYFSDCIPDLKAQFVPNYSLSSKVTELKNKIQQCNSIGVHIRRGDFVKLGWAEDYEYYKRGMDEIKKKINNPHFFIVTDDKLWVKDTFKESDITIIDVPTDTCDIDEFFLLSLCDHHIISESTFGWWAAFLNINPNRIIVIPTSAKGALFQSLENTIKI